MKRSFSEFDAQIPKSLLERFPTKAKHLERIANIETLIEDRWNSYRRTALEANCELKVKRKVIRIYIRHEFVPSSPEVGAHILVTVEGRLLDPIPMADAPLGMFFDEVKVVPDRRYNVDNMQFEWTRDKFPAGVRAQCFRFKLQCDRPIPMTVRLTRSEYAVKRYELSSGLRQLLPRLPCDPTENEVLTALWEYINMYDLCLDKAIVRCDENLKRITEVDNISMSQLRTIVASHLFPCKSIDIDYTAHTTSFNDNDVPEKRFGAVAYHKSGGKCFDLNVDVLEHDNHKILDILNKGSQKEEKMQSDLEKIQHQCSFLLLSLHRHEREVLELESLSHAPIPLTLLSDEKSISQYIVPKKSGSLETHLPQCFEDTLPSEIHSLGNYLDISQDDLFSEKYEWFKRAAYASTSH